MKPLVIFFIAALTTLSASAQSLEAYFHHAEFDSPEGPYIETYLSTIGRTATFVKTDKGYQANIEITMLFKQNDSIRSFKKYIINSPVIEDSVKKRPNFVDVQRIPLEPGRYDLEVIIRDANKTTSSYLIEDEFNLNFPDENLAFSGFQPVESFTSSDEASVLTKSGLKMVPYVSNFYPGNIDKLNFYLELYNADKAIGEQYLLKYYISEYENKEPVESIGRHKRMEATAITPVTGQLDISDLRSGNYEVMVEAISKENKILAQTSYFIQRSKPVDLAELEDMDDFEMDKMFAGKMDNRDSLIYYIKSLRPIANEREKRFIDRDMHGTDLNFMKRFFYTFWYDKNSQDPGGEWKVYRKQVGITEKLFATRTKHGFETDRGRVYLEYGPPNDAYANDHEPSAYPYEIWSYYRAGDQRNKKFVFYNPNLAGDDYELLHSNVRGELQTPNWERFLSKRNNDLYNQDIMQSDDQWGSRAREYYDSH
ncbi:MAG: GWxTD domain-containing protein [Bacteroidota bacterium]